MSALARYPKDHALSKIALALFLLCLPLSLRKVFLVIDPSGSGVFNEYTDISLYLSDLALLLLLGSIILENKKCILSISWWKKNMFHVEHWSIVLLAPAPFLLWAGASIFWSKSEILATYAFFKLIEGYLIYLAMIYLIVPRGTIGKFSSCELNSNCSTWNNPDNLVEKKDMFHVEQLSEKTDPFIAYNKNVPRGTFVSYWEAFKDRCSTWNNLKTISLVMAFSGFLEAILAIMQFVWQRSLGLVFLQESHFSAYGSGIAKVIIGSEPIVRAYGLFPHPNVLAGYLAITILFTVFYPLIFQKKMFHVEQSLQTSGVFPINVPRGTFSFYVVCSTWNKLESIFSNIKSMFHVEHSGLYYRLALSVQLIGFLVTFSKSALIGLLLASIYTMYEMFHVEQLPNNASKGVFSDNNVPRGTLWDSLIALNKKCSTWNSSNGIFEKSKKMFHVEHSLFLIGTLITGYFIIAFIKGINWYYYFVQPLNERLFAYHEAKEIFFRRPFQGVGIGQSVLTMQDFFTEKLQIWQFQPIHDIYLLVFSEIGFAGSFLFFGFIGYLWLKIRLISFVPRGTKEVNFSEVGDNCSTWNNSKSGNLTEKLFHVEQPLTSLGENYSLKENVPRGTINNKLLGTLFSVLLLLVAAISLFDHYFWDIEQGQLLLWMIAGLAGATAYQRDIDK